MAFIANVPQDKVVGANMIRSGKRTKSITSKTNAVEPDQGHRAHFYRMKRPVRGREREQAEADNHQTGR